MLLAARVTSQRVRCTRQRVACPGGYQDTSGNGFYGLPAILGWALSPGERACSKCLTAATRSSLHGSERVVGRASYAHGVSVCDRAVWRRHCSLQCATLYGACGPSRRGGSVGLSV